MGTGISREFVSTEFGVGYKLARLSTYGLMGDMRSNFIRGCFLIHTYVPDGETQTSYMWHQTSLRWRGTFSAIQAVGALRRAAYFQQEAPDHHYGMSPTGSILEVAAVV
jgi:hypothetical protein